MKTKNITGYRKKLFILWLEISIFIHYVPKVIKGKLSLKNFLNLLKRLSYFLSKLKHNKFVKIGSNTRIDLYCPGFPSKAFYTASDKFNFFEGKLPCTTVLLSITSACNSKCMHCYQKLDVGKDVNIDTLVKTVKKLQDMGIAFFNIEGGEPFMVYERLIKICTAIDKRSEIWINSTGHGITLERLVELKNINVTGIMFSLHSPEPQKMNDFMGNNRAWDNMSKAVALCHEGGISPAFNCCLQKEDFYNGTFEKIMEEAKNFGASLIQIIKPKPAGGWLKSGVKEFKDEDINKVLEKVNKYNLEKKYKDYPVISAQIIEESKNQFGCTAGGTDRFYINSKGDLQPCEFLNISFGNIVTDDFDVMYKKMRNCFNEACDCWLCEKYSGDVLKLYEEYSLKSLPLPTDLSEKIYNNWDRGNPTELYDKIENMK